MEGRVEGRVEGRALSSDGLRVGARLEGEGSGTSNSSPDSPGHSDAGVWEREVLLGLGE